MGSIKCLNCLNEITIIPSMECPHCKAQLSDAKIAFLSYLGPEDSLVGYQRSYKLVLMKCIFSEILEAMPSFVHKDEDRQYLILPARRVTEAFRDYYLARVKEGLPPDKGVDSRIENIENSSLQDVWLVIHMNPLAAIQKQGFLRVSGEGLNGEFVLQKDFSGFTAKEFRNLIDILDRKLKFYYSKINSYALSETSSPSERSIEEGTEKLASVSYKDPEVFEAKDDKAYCEDDTASGAMESIIPIEELSLSTRAFNALKRSKIDTLGQLVKAYNNGSLAEIRNIGKIVIEEIAGVLNDTEFKTQEKVSSYSGKFTTELPFGIADKRIDEMFEGGMFNIFVRHCHRTDRNQIKDLVGFNYEELLTIRGLGAKKISAVLERFKQLEQLSINGAGADSVSEISMLIQEKKIYIHPTNWGCDVSILRLVGITSIAISMLNEAGHNKLGDLDGIAYQVFARKIRHRSTAQILKVLEQFEKPFKEVLDEFLDECAEDKAFDMLLRRAEGRTLQNVAEEYSITRERVRQICNNEIRKLNVPCSFIAEMLMTENGGRWFRKDQIYDLIVNLNYAKTLTFVFENSDEYYCIHSSGVFVQKTAFPGIEVRLPELVSDIVAEGVNVFESADKIEDVLESAGFGFITSDDFLGILIDLDYTFYGDYVLKNRTSYGWLCARIVEEEYPDGISNTKEDMIRLRELVQQKYGDLDLPESDRSVYARLCNHLILRGRSKYIAPSRVYADESILSEIKSYIERSKQKDIFYSELFAEFEGLLLMMTNIDNAQFLHGVLRYHYPADYSYSRDFLSKES